MEKVRTALHTTIRKMFLSANLQDALKWLLRVAGKTRLAQNKGSINRK
jgi:hypothetical protein